MPKGRVVSPQPAPHPPLHSEALFSAPGPRHQHWQGAPGPAAPELTEAADLVGGARTPWRPMHLTPLEELRTASAAVAALVAVAGLLAGWAGGLLELAERGCPKARPVWGVGHPRGHWLGGSGWWPIQETP